MTRPIAPMRDATNAVTESQPIANKRCSRVRDCLSMTSKAISAAGVKAAAMVAGKIEMMKMPFVTRSHHEEVVALLKLRFEDTQRELHRLKDLICQNSFGVQLHDTLPVPAVAPEAEPESEPEMTEEERERSEEIRELNVLYRTRPSQLGAKLTEFMRRGLIRRAANAHPQHVVAAHPAQQVFAKAKQQAEAN